MGRGWSKSLVTDGIFQRQPLQFLPSHKIFFPCDLYLPLLESGVYVLSLLNLSMFMTHSQLIECGRRDAAWQKRRCVASKARSQKVMQVPSCYSPEMLCKHLTAQGRHVVRKSK